MSKLKKGHSATNQEEEQRVTAGLDIGTSKVCALIATPGEKSDKLNILGTGITESEGLNRGVVINIEKTVKSIKMVIEQAEQQSGLKVDDVVVGIAGDHIESFQTKGIIGISNPTKEITMKDVERVLEESRNIKIPAERRILHVIPQEYIIDGQDGISDPVSMSGVRLEANVHVVTGLETAAQNIHRCVERIGLNVSDIVLEPLASSYAVLDDEEKEVGVALVDIGGGTTDIAIFEGNIIRFTSVFAIAGKQLTDDIRKGLGVIASQAERVKREYGHAYMDSILKDEVFMIPGIGGRKPMEVAKSYLCQIIQPRMEEIFEFALAEIQRSGFAGSLGAGVVVTGGSSLLRGVEELAQDIFEMPVKIGMPSGISYSGLAPEIENPVYSTAVGLALYGIDNNDHMRTLQQKLTDKDVAAEAEIAEENVKDQETAESKIKEKSKSFLEKTKRFLQDL